MPHQFDQLHGDRPGQRDHLLLQGERGLLRDCIDPCLLAPDIESARSTEASATTGFSVPPGPPTGLTATAAGSSRIRLSWTAPTATAGAPVTGYKIYAGTSPGGESLTDSSSATSDTVSRPEQRDHVLLRGDGGLQSISRQEESARSNEASATTDRAIPRAQIADHRLLGRWPATWSA